MPWIQALEEVPPAESSRALQTGFLVAWGSVSALALGAGVTVGYRGFEDTAAFEALDKMEKPTPAAEAMASRMAARRLTYANS